MRNRSSKQDSRDEDEDIRASRVIDAIIQEPEMENESLPERKKNPAAVQLGRLGGLKGGKARAAKLSAAKRSEIAKLAADSRWKKRDR